MVLSFQHDKEKEKVNNQLKRNISLKLSGNVMLFHIQPVVVQLCKLFITNKCSSSDGVGVGGKV